jgi:CelD/BcsL family acetyltransferase involved in cellulose biosynthesis
MSRTLVLASEEELAPYLAGWDALAAACERPLCLSAWMLAWWREAREAKGELRVVVVLDGEEVIGVGPFFASPTMGLIEMRLLGAGFCHRIGPLARPGEEDRVAAALAEALAGVTPTPASVVFEGVDAGDAWPRRIADHWPGRTPRLRTDATMDAPLVELGADYDSWLGRRSRNFRKSARRRANRLEDEGVKPRSACDQEAVAALLRLHHARWSERGGSGVDEGAERVIAAAAESLDGRGRIEVVLLDGPEGPIAAELVVHAGAAATFWSGGFDPEWSRYAPGTQGILAALELAAPLGTQVADLGGGGDEYKSKLADDSRPIAWQTVYPRGIRYPLIRLRLAPKHSWHGLRKASRRLPEPVRERAKRLLGRG